MGIQQVGSDGTTIAEVDLPMKAQRVSLRPGPVSSWSSYGLTTSALTGLAAGAPILSLRNTGSAQLVVRRLQLQFTLTTGFIAAQRMEWALYAARSWTVADTGGVQANTNSGRHRQGLSALSMDLRYFLALAITAGTRTLDAQPIAVTSMWAGAAGASMAPVTLISTDAGDHPFVLGANEGMVLSNAFAMGSTGAGIAYISLELAEGQYP